MKSDAKVLEIGSGTGYLTHLIAETMNGTGQIIGIEHVPELVNASIQNILYSNPDLLVNGHIKFVGKYLQSNELFNLNVWRLINSRPNKILYI